MRIDHPSCIGGAGASDRSAPDGIRLQNRFNTDGASNTHLFAPLDTQTFAAVVANAPLVSIDLIVEDAQGAVLLGWRNNPPAKGCWFVPGGRIRKGERLDEAFSRIAIDELGRTVARTQGRLLGVHEHFYDTNFIGATDAATHYVVLAYRLQLERESLKLPVQQHSRYIWMQPGLLAGNPDVHPYTQAYFQN